MPFNDEQKHELLTIILEHTKPLEERFATTETTINTMSQTLTGFDNRVKTIDDTLKTNIDSVNNTINTLKNETFENFKNFNNGQSTATEQTETEPKILSVDELLNTWDDKK